MHDKNRSLIPTALFCVFLLLVVVLAGGVIGIMYTQRQALQAQNDALNMQMLTIQAQLARHNQMQMELETVNQQLKAQAEELKATNKQLEARLDALNEESE